MRECSCPVQDIYRTSVFPLVGFININKTAFAIQYELAISWTAKLECNQELIQMIAIYSTDIQRRNYPTQLHAWTLIVTLQVNWFFLRQTREKPLQKKKKNSSFSIICRTELVDEKPNFVLVKTGLRQCQACPSVSSLPYSHQNGLWTGNFCKNCVMLSRCWNLLIAD